MIFYSPGSRRGPARPQAGTRGARTRARSRLFYAILTYSILFYSTLFYYVIFYSILFYYILLFSRAALVSREIRTSGK